MTDAQSPILVIAGASSGLGQALASRFHDDGWRVAALSRSDHRLQHCALTLTTELSDEQEVDRAFGQIESQLGVPRAVVYNAHHLVVAPLAEVSADDFHRSWASTALGAFLVAKRALARMAAGSLILSGATASIRGSARFGAFASAKFALRGLAQSLAQEYGDRGVHIAHVILDGLILCEQTSRRFAPDPASCIRPQSIAQMYRTLVEQPRDAWTFELDLRPAPRRNP